MFQALIGGAVRYGGRLIGRRAPNYGANFIRRYNPAGYNAWKQGGINPFGGVGASQYGPMYSGGGVGFGQKLAGIKDWAMPIAIMYSGSMMGGWAGTNVYQTERISDDAEKSRILQEERLQWEKDKWEAEEEARQDEYEHGLLQTGIIESFDAKDRAFQAQMQSNQMSFEAQMYEAKMQQMAQDRNTYLANQAFQTYTGGRMTSKDDQFTIAFILTELMGMLAQESNQEIDQPDLDPFYEPDFADFDNFNEY